MGRISSLRFLLSRSMRSAKLKAFSSVIKAGLAALFMHALHVQRNECFTALSTAAGPWSTTPATRPNWSFHDPETDTARPSRNGVVGDLRMGKGRNAGSCCDRTGGQHVL